MAVTHVELYEALKGSVGEKAARMIAEIVPVAADVARTNDVLAVRQDLAEAVSTLRLEISEATSLLRRDVFAAISELRRDIAAQQQQIANARSEAHALNTRTIQWILGVTIPLWIGTWGMMAAILLRGS